VHGGVIYLSGTIRAELVGLREDVGFMLTPQMGNAPDLSRTWHAFDTGTFQNKVPYVREGYAVFLHRQQRTQHRCLFATAPDVWADGPATLDLAGPELSTIRELGYRAALVLQPGVTPALLDSFGWGRIDAVFVGGPDVWQDSAVVQALVTEAHRRGKWAHRGRVNSHRRLSISRARGFDSADGTYLKYGPDVNLPKMLMWLDWLRAQPLLPLEVV
jgi:hypothetical protein